MVSARQAQTCSSLSSRGSQGSHVGSRIQGAGAARVPRPSAGQQGRDRGPGRGSGWDCEGQGTWRVWGGTPDSLHVEGECEKVWGTPGGQESPVRVARTAELGCLPRPRDFRGIGWGSAGEVWGRAGRQGGVSPTCPDPWPPTTCPPQQGFSDALCRRTGGQKGYRDTDPRDLSRELEGPGPRQALLFFFN